MWFIETTEKWKVSWCWRRSTFHLLKTVLSPYNWLIWAHAVLPPFCFFLAVVGAFWLIFLGPELILSLWHSLLLQKRKKTGLVCESYQEREQIWPASPSFPFPSHHLVVCIVCSTQEQAECRYRGGHFYIVMPWPLLNLLVTPWELLFHWLLIMLFLHKDRVDTSPLKWMVGWGFAWHDPSSFLNSGQLFMLKLMGTRYQ